MAAPVIYSGSFSWLGLATETTYGTAAAAPTVWIPLLTVSWKPNIKVIMDEAMRGSMAKEFGASNGPRSDVLSFETYPYLDSLGPIMRSMLGSTDTVTGTADPYSHVMSLNNVAPGQPPSYTLWLYNGAECWQQTGSVCGKVEVDMKAEELGKVSTEWTGLPATTVTAPTNTPSTASPWAGVQTTTTVAGTSVTIYSDVKLAFTRDIQPVYTAAGSYTPYVIYAGALSAQIDLQGVYTGLSGSDLNNLITNTHPSVVVVGHPTGDATHTGTWHFNSTAAMNSEPKMASGKYVEIASTYKAIANSTDATASGLSPVKFTLLNSVSTAY